MAKQGQSGENGSKKLTVVQIQEMYDSLGLAICDDASLIAEKIKKMRPRKVKEKSSVTESVAYAAKQWIANVEKLKNHRDELIGLVYEYWAADADDLLADSRERGETTLTRELVQRLRRRADFHKIDDPLAERFVARYMLERNYREGTTFVEAQPVQEFRAVSRVGVIALSWAPPPGCDAVRVTRQRTVPSGGQPQLVYQGQSVRVEDVGLEVGATFTYRAYSVYGKGPGARESTPVSRSGLVFMADLEDVRARVEQGEVTFEWRLPAPNASVVVFKREGAKPKVSSESPRRADEADTVRLDAGRGQSSFVDREVAAGRTYFYLFSVDFGSGPITAGVSRKVDIAKPPPDVRSLVATFAQERNGCVVHLRWCPVRSGNAPVRYVVVRREGAGPPASIDDGIASDPIADSSYRDTGVIPGRRYAWSVFAVSAGVPSLEPARAGPIDIKPEVTRLEAIAGDRSIDLSWDAPENVKRVIVRRSLEPVRSPEDGKLVISAVNRASDHGLTNGRQYHYAAFCVYEIDGREELSDGEAAQAMPAPPPKLAGDFRLRRRGVEVVCQFVPPTEGNGLVMRSAESLDLSIGQRVPATRLHELGETVQFDGEGRAIDSSPRVDAPYYTLFSVSGAEAVVCGSGSCVVFPDVTSLCASATQDGVVLRWNWPDGADSVVVARRGDAWPEGVGDAVATRSTVTRQQYREAGNRFVDRIGRDQGRFHYVVYTRIPGAKARVFTQGNDDSCRTALEWGPWMTLRYRIERQKRGRGLELSWSIEDRFEGFAGFVLAGKESWVPDGPNDGIELFRWQARNGAERGEATISLKPATERRWSRLYCKAFVLDPVQASRTLFVHPNTCAEIPLDGQTRPRIVVAEKFSHKVPKTATCPYCLKVFSIRDIDYASYADATLDAKKASYGFFRRLAGRRPRAPEGFTRKLCPECREDLPFSAGNQKSLIIGLVGAAASGKSHYIASLIHRLQGQVGSDFSAGLIHSTDETPELYRTQFYEPLFERQLELDITIARPRPLVYDLTFDKKLFGSGGQSRSVTLALYDSAGHELEKPKEARRMCNYLGIASGLIFLMDPVQSQLLERDLVSGGADEAPGVDLKKHDVVRTVIKLMKEAGLSDDDRPMSMPVAVALTKCDLLRDVGLIPANRLWSTDRRHVGAYDLELHDDTNGMMGELTQQLLPQLRSPVHATFPRHAFFGVSATGSNPTSSSPRTRRYPFVAPWRVEDPLLWLLAELGVIPTKRRS